MSKLLMALGVVLVLIGAALYIKGQNTELETYEYNFLTRSMEHLDHSTFRADKLRNGMMFGGAGMLLILIGAVIRVGDKTARVQTEK